MKNTRLTAAVLSFIIAASAPASVSAATSDTKTVHTVTFLDFDGSVIKTLSVADGGTIDYSQIDTSALSRHKDVYTEQQFAQWSMTPKTADRDLTIQALSKTAVISIDGMPSRSVYFSKQGNVSLEGLAVTITVTTQTPEQDKNGDYICDVTTVDITSVCTASPGDLKTAFADKNTADVNVFTIGDTKPVVSYQISCRENHGDVNGDGKTDAVDASHILNAYSEISSGSSVDDDFLWKGDVDLDGKITASDASIALNYYAIASSHQTPDWEEILGLK